MGSIITICPDWNALRAEKLKNTSGQSVFDKGEDIQSNAYQNSSLILLTQLTEELQCRNKTFCQNFDL